MNLLFDGTVSSYNFLFDGTLPSYNLLFGGTASSNNFYLAIISKLEYQKSQILISNLPLPQLKLLIFKTKFNILNIRLISPSLFYSLMCFFKTFVYVTTVTR